MRVQVTSTRVLRVSGERQISENKWRRFRKEFPMLSDSDTSGISAKFEAGILYVKLPKVINKQPQTQEIPKPQQPITTTTTQKPNNYGQVSDQKKPIKKEKPEVEEQKKVPHEPKANEKEDSKEKPKKEKGKEKLVDDDDNVNNKVGKEKVEGANAILASKGEKKHGNGLDGKMHKRSSSLEMLSIQKKEYLNALSGLVDEVKKQKKLVNMVFLIFFGLLFGLYVKNAIKSYF